MLSKSLVALTVFVIPTCLGPWALAGMPMVASDLQAGSSSGSSFSANAKKKVAKAEAILSNSDPAMVNDINAAISAGTLSMGELDSAAKAKGVADGDTILVKTKGAAPVVVAARIAHEYLHWKYGQNGAVDDCTHAGIWAHTIWDMLEACWEGTPFPCNNVDKAKASYTKYLNKCPTGVAVDPVTGQPWVFTPGMWDVCCE